MKKHIATLKASSLSSIHFLLIIIFVFLAGLSTTFIFLTRGATQDANEANQRKNDLVTATYRFHAYAMDLTRLSRMYVVTGNASIYEQRMQIMSDGTIEDILHIVGRYATMEEQLMFEEILEGFHEHRELEAQAFSLMAEGYIDEAIELVYGDGYTTVSQPMHVISDILVRDIYIRNLEEVHEAQRRASIFETQSVIVTVLLALAAVFGIAFMVHRFEVLLENHIESTNRSQFILDSLPLIITLWDEKFNIVDCNAEVLRRLNLKEKSEYINNFTSFMPELQPDGTPSTEMAYENLTSFFKEGGTVEWHYTDLEGKHVPQEATCFPMEYRGKHMLLVCARDLTDVRYREELLNVVNQAAATLLAVDEKESFTGALLESMELIGQCLKVDRTQLWQINLVPEGIHINLINQWQTEIGKSYPQIEFEQLIPFGILPEWDEIAINKTTLNGPVANMSAQAQQFLNSHNTLKSLFLIPVILHDELWGLFTMDDCVNERTLTEKEMDIIRSASLMIATSFYRLEQASVKKEQEFKERWQVIHEATPIGVNFLNENFQLIDSNEVAYKKIFGFDDKEEYMANMHLTLPEVQPDGTATMERIASDLKIVINEGYYRNEWMVKNYVGDHIPLDVSAVRIVNENNGVKEIMIATYLQDLRPIKAAMALVEKQRIVRMEAAEESNRAKSRFLARMSHEIRTPISAVLGISEIELQTPGLSPQIEESFAKIHNSAATLLSIVNDILDLSKIEAGKMEIIESDYDTTSMISDVAHLHLNFIGSKRIKFVLDVDENLPSSMVGDALRIVQVMNNLLSNAFKYTESGVVTLSLEWDENLSSLVITIQDTGFGMNEEQLNDLHREYTRFHERKIPGIIGTGLGMPIVYSMVQMMDGNINLESKIGEGTKVNVQIPQKKYGSEVLGKELAQRLQQFEEGRSSADKKFKFTPEPMPYGKVLVVDDVEANLYVARGLLAFYGLNVETCDSGYEAIEKVKQGKVYDIVFMDQMMPGLNGDEAMSIMRDLGYYHPIVTLTANAMIGQAEELIEYGFDGFISKPIQTSHLNAILTKHIRDKQPPEVIEAAKAQMADADGDSNKAVLDDYQNNVQLIAKLRQDFAKNHRDTFDLLRESLADNDITTAHRLAHTLKGVALLIKEDNLAEAARIVEQALAEDIQLNQSQPTQGQLTQSQLTHVKNELEKVLKNITGEEELPGYKEFSDDKDFSGDKDFDKEKASELFQKLVPLLETSNAGALDLLDELRQYKGTSELVSQIEAFEFAAALECIKNIDSQLKA